jgi:hypothetical protein
MNLSTLGLERFVEAQHRVYDGVVDEIAMRHKTSHWMWFILPTFRELGRSPIAKHFGIASRQKAVFVACRSLHLFLKSLVFGRFLNVFLEASKIFAPCNLLGAADSSLKYRAQYQAPQGRCRQVKKGHIRDDRTPMFKPERGLRGLVLKNMLGKHCPRPSAKTP